MTGYDQISDALYQVEFHHMKWLATEDFYIKLAEFLAVAMPIVLIFFCISAILRKVFKSILIFSALLTLWGFQFIYILFKGIIHYQPPFIIGYASFAIGVYEIVYYVRYRN